MRHCAVVGLALACAVSSAALSSCAPAPPVPTLPAARPTAPDSRVGAVFVGGSAMHTCSGAVLASAGGDLILTAAHCLADGVDASFVPRFAGGAVSDEGLPITAVYLDPRWVSEQDPMADFAIARVSPHDHRSLEASAHGGLRLGTTPAPGTDVTVTGYAAGIGGPMSCRAPTSPSRHGLPSLRCDGVAPGFSGAPWITGSTVSGVVGGLDGGGCADDVSYSPPFDGAVVALLELAEASGPGDRAPTVFDDGCG